jgi:O-antigen/teichoic acid export membrane protein
VTGMGALQRLARNSAVLTSAQLVTKALAVIYAVALSRYLGPAGFGQIGTALAVTSVAYVFVDFGLGTLTTRDVARNHEEAAYYASTTVGVKLALMGLVNVGLVAYLLLTHYSGQQRAIIWIYSANAALSALITIGAAIFQGFEEMHKPAILQFVRDVLNIVLSLAAIALHQSIYVIVGASVLATWIQLLGMGILIRGAHVQLSAAIVRLRGAYALLLESIPFGAFIVLATVYGQLAVIMMSLLTDPASTGLYVVAVSLSSLAALIPSVFSQAVFPLFSRYHARSEETLRYAYEKSFKLLTVLGTGIGVALALAMQDLVTHVFGAKYAGAVPAATILVLTQVLSANFVNGSFLNATGHQRLFTATYGVAVLVQLALSWITIPRMGVLGAAVSFVIPSVVGYVYYTALSHRLLQIGFPWRTQAKVVMAAALGAVAALGAELGHLPAIVGGLLVVPVVYGGLCILLGVLSKEDWSLARDALGSLGGRLQPIRIQEGG